ncbi:TraR/DksA family transcriptional regulator [Streptomyces sp. NPDC001985]|uniref:TraR/DksA family transcriptional regulator n=1 Tax=Streptomyces sp. NPDC001985 TaxID=3154406 RepID=UPI0033210542
MVAKKTAESDPASVSTTAASAPAEGRAGPASARRTAGTTPAEKAPAKKAAARKAVAKKAVAKKAVAKKAVAKKAAARKAAAKKSAAGTGAAGKAVAGRTAAGTAPDGKAGARTPARTAKKTARKTAARKAPTAAAPARQTGAPTVRAKKTVAAGTGPAAVPTARAADEPAPGELAVRPGEEPWTPEEVAEARALLESDVTRLNAELTASEAALANLMRDSGGGSGGDDADTGTKNITREHELSLAANAREVLEQTERALQRLEAGTYGLCENCGKPIGKARMQAFPRATLCVECKQKQERRG